MEKNKEFIPIIITSKSLQKTITGKLYPHQQKQGEVIVVENETNIFYVIPNTDIEYMKLLGIEQHDPYGNGKRTNYYDDSVDNDKDFIASKELSEHIDNLIEKSQLAFKLKNVFQTVAKQKEEENNQQEKSIVPNFKSQPKPVVSSKFEILAQLVYLMDTYPDIVYFEQGSKINNDLKVTILFRDIKEEQ